ncbi:MAG TPA: hypothetical protein VL084_08355 [Thermoanaerobaculia bacterium]|nr:hypothetical protein [Thermoanaerobaculia bacterium]
MRKILTLSLVAALVAVAALPAVAADKAPEPKKITNVQSVTATITAIDAAKRLITLKGPKGESLTFEASQEVKRFNELKVGDEVTIKYTESLVARIAKPGEMSSAGVTGGRHEGKPGGAVKSETTIVVTLMNIDMETPSVTFKTADGDVISRHVKDKKNLEGFKVGDKVALTYSESLAIDVATPAKK